MNAADVMDPPDATLARSALYGAIAAPFRNPDSPLFATFALRAEAEALQNAVFLGCGTDDTLAQAVADLNEQAQNVTLPALCAAHAALFGNTSRGPVAPYETEYGTGGPFMQPQELSDITGFYQAFGLALDPDQHDRCDHFCCECEFMCFLHAREAGAIEAGDEETRAITARAQSLFLRDHLGRFGHTFLHRLRQAAPTPWHAAAARFAAAFLEAECRRMEIPIGRNYLPMRPAEDLDIPIACGACSLPCGEVAQPGD